MMAIVVILMIGGAGCKSKKKAMEANAAAAKAKMEQEAALQREKEKDAELKRKQEADEQARRDSEANSKKVAPSEKLDLFFSAIANSSNVNSANTSIDEVLALFASPQTPVLIVISEEGGQKDYDRPTTIRDYLDYLKDQKKNANKVLDMKVDSSGMITELELVKK